MLDLWQRGTEDNKGLLSIAAVAKSRLLDLDEQTSYNHADGTIQLIIEYYHSVRELGRAAADRLSSVRYR